MTGPELLKPGEVLDMFGIHRKTLARWRKDGLLDGAMVATPGGAARYKRAELEKLAAGAAGRAWPRCGAAAR